MGEGETLGSIEVREKVPLFIPLDTLDKELRLFLDESGDYGSYVDHSPAYCFSFVLVEPNSDYIEEEKRFCKKVSCLTGGDHFVHVGNLVRAEKPYEEMLREDRSRLFGALLFYYLHSNLKHASFMIRKEGIIDKEGMELTLRIADSLGRWINERLDYLQSFSSVRIIYDYGQPSLARAILAAFAAKGIKVVIEKKKQDECSLLQVADLLCNVELLNYKIEQGSLTHSDIAFFGLKRKIKKDLIKPLALRKI